MPTDHRPVKPVPPLVKGKAGHLQRLRNLAARDRQEIFLLAEATLRLVALRLCFVVIRPLRQRQLCGTAQSPAECQAANTAITLDTNQTQSAKRIGWAIRRGERTLPFDVVCLPQALVGRRMLRNRGIPSVMFFGVEKGKPLSAVGTHAWLVAGAVDVTGFPQAARYSAFAGFAP